MNLGLELEADEVIPNLWQGSFPRILSAAEAGFDLVVLCAQEMLRGDVADDYQMHGIRVIEAPFDDTPWPSGDELKMAHWAAAKVAAAHRDGKKILVTCQAGLNRSGLVNALAVREIRGLPGHEAVLLVRGARDGALCNNTFAMYVYNMK
jgi:hypothetical protein